MDIHSMYGFLPDGRVLIVRDYKNFNQQSTVGMRESSILPTNPLAR
jgi:hypothetical protein